MARFAFLHAADLHLDTPFSGVGRVPGDVAAALRDASIEAWDALVDLAIARDVAAVLLAGGLCDGLERGVRAQARLRDGLHRLVAHGVRVAVALAAHDPPAGVAGLDGWPDGVTVFGEGVRSVALERDGVRLALLHGVAPRAGDAVELVRGIGVGDASLPQLGLLHAAVGGAEASDTQCPSCPLPVLRDAALDYWALGHAHALTYVSRDLPWIVYPGTPQGRGLAPGESGAKGAVLVEVTDGVIDQVTFEPLDRVRCMRVELGDAADLEDVRRALTARAAALHEAHAGRALVLEATVRGTPAVQRALCRPDACSGLLRTLRRAAARWEPFVWWAAVRPVMAAPAPAAGDDLTGMVRRMRAELAADPGQGASFLARRFEPLHYAWTAEVEPREASELLDAAAELAADVLDDAESGA